MYPSTPIHPLLCEADLVPASTLLNHRQRQYAYRLLSLPDQHLTKNILPVSLRNGDGDFQPGELSVYDLMWTGNTRPTLYGQWLAWQITIEYSINPADGVEPVATMEPDEFKGRIIIQAKKHAIEEAKKYWPGLVKWTDGSKLDQGAGAAVCWRRKSLNPWKEKVFFG